MTAKKKTTSRTKKTGARKSGTGRASSRRGRGRKKQESLPKGWGQQVAAIVMLALAAFLVITWFSGEESQAFKIIYSIIGNAMYVVPFLFTYLSIKVFRSEDNHLSPLTWFAAVFVIMLTAGASGVATYGAGKGAHGGAIGEWMNELFVPMFGFRAIMLIYVVMVMICLLFILQVTPGAIMEAIKEVFGEKAGEQKKKAQIAVVEEQGEEAREKKRLEFRVNKGVAIQEEENKGEPKPVSKRGLFGRKKEKAAQAEENRVERETVRAGGASATVGGATEAKNKGALVAVQDMEWIKPGVELLEKKQSPADAGNIQQNAVVIKTTLAEFGIDVEMEGANIGPRVTQYTMRPPAGVNLSKIVARDKELALNLAVDKIRIEAPIPGTRSVGVEIPNAKSADVRLRGIIESQEWKKATDPLTFAVGKDISGKAVVANLAKMPHLLIAGTTGSGKSVMSNTLIASLLYRNSPSDLKLIIIDPKQVEMAQYEDVPHLLTPIITSTEKALSAMKWAVNEMEKRYSLMAELKVKNIVDYNEKIKSAEVQNNEEKAGKYGYMPYIVVIIDEMADLMMMAGKDLEILIVRIAQKGRASGIHLVLATQRPEVKVITGLIKANIPGRIAFAVGSSVDSRIMLDQGGAEKLLGKGDMLMLTTEMMGKPRRIQGAWSSDQDIAKLTDYLRAQRPPEYNDEVVAQAVEISLAKGKFSTAMLQTYLGKGHGFVSGLAVWFEEIGVIGPQNGNRPRDMLIKSLEEFDNLANM